MKLFEDAVREGHLDNKTATLYAYGTYLNNGGRVEDFLRLKPDDIQIMVSSRIAELDRQNISLLKGIGVMFGGKE